MSYHIYTTQGIILKRTPFGEANILVHILTRDLGLIMASAQSARQTKSKLSSALSEFSEVTVSCIKGKKGWKLTDARSNLNFYFAYPEHVRSMLALISSLLFKMIPDEAVDFEIYETVHSGFTFLKNITKENIQNFECLIVLRILFYLGYVVRDSSTEKFLEHTTEWNDSIIEEIGKRRLELVKIINLGFSASHLT